MRTFPPQSRDVLDVAIDVEVEELEESTRAGVESTRRQAPELLLYPEEEEPWYTRAGGYR